MFCCNKPGSQSKIAIKTNWRQKTLLFTRNSKRSGSFCTAFIAEMDVFFPLLSQILRPFGKRIKADFYHVLKFEQRSIFREVGTTDSHQQNVLKCGEKVGTSKLFWKNERTQGTVTAVRKMCCLRLVGNFRETKTTVNNDMVRTL